MNAVLHILQVPSNTSAYEALHSQPCPRSQKPTPHILLSINTKRHRLRHIHPVVHSALPLCSLWQEQSSDLPVTTFSPPPNLATHVHPLRIIPDISSSRNCAYLLFLKLHKENLFQNHSALHILFSHYFETFYIRLYFSGTMFH